MIEVEIGSDSGKHCGSYGGGGGGVYLESKSKTHSDTGGSEIHTMR